MTTALAVEIARELAAPKKNGLGYFFGIPFPASVHLKEMWFR